MYILCIYILHIYIYTYYCREIERCVHMYLYYITRRYFTLHCIALHHITLHYKYVYIRVCLKIGYTPENIGSPAFFLILLFSSKCHLEHILHPSSQDLATDRDLSWLSPSRPDQRIISARAHLRFVRTDVQKEAGVKCWRMSNSSICDKSGAAVKLISGLYNSS